MAELKTKETKASVTAFINSIDDRQQRADSKKLAALMRAATGKRARMWGSSIVGFDRYHYQYASGREGDWPIIGFSPRKQNLAVYIMPGFSQFDALMKKLGKFKTGKSCLYIKRLEDVDTGTLEKLIDASVRHMRSKYPTS
ncbi:MAG: DUF1801 domain-containing protein [Gammaproteobacteria bacterium]|nr:DUF1801 domain-containing protein [Gammaproteobacteria bacterium]